MKKLFSKYLTDILMVDGCVCILIGLAQWNVVITWIVGGLMLVGMGVMVGMVRHIQAKEMAESTKKKSVE